MNYTNITYIHIDTVLVHTVKYRSQQYLLYVVNKTRMSEIGTYIFYN